MTTHRESGPAVGAIAIAAGAVTVEVAAGTRPEDLRLRLRDLEAGFEPLGPAEAEAARLAAGLRPVLGLQPGGAAPPEGEAAGRVTAWVNGLPDWSPPGVRTLQLRITGRGAPQLLRVAAPLVLPATDRPLVVRAGLGAHRASARLVLTVTSRAEPAAPPRRREIPFEPDRHGGRSPEDFEPVEWVLPPSDDERELAIAIDYAGYRGAADGLDPYLILSDPRVTAAGAGSALDLVAPPADLAGAAWLRAPVPDLMAEGDRLELVAGDRMILLREGAGGAVTLVEEHGHRVVLRSDHPGPLCVRIDGEVVREGVIPPGGVAVPVPYRFLTGGLRRLDVVDRGGVQAFLRTVIDAPRLLTPPEILQSDSAPPFPGALLPQAAHRFTALRRHLELGVAEGAQAQLAWALTALETGEPQLVLRPLAFPAVEAPDVSVVIPVHDHVRTTYLALCSLLLAPNRCRFEVIVVDDGSTDATRRLEEIVSGITVVRHATPERFVRACNAGVARARGGHVVLLNNDVEVTEGWLDELLAAFRRFGRVGLAGAKLLDPSGRLQDAGGLVWGSGNPWNYGRGANPWEPRFCYARRADYLSGAALMASREAWDAVGGLSAEFEPMYFEDTDLAFRMREAGFSTWFVPSAVVYHHEGGTSGTDVAVGPKRFQEVNRPKFKRRWAAAFAGHGREGVEPDLEKDRGVAGRVLFIDYGPPRPDRDAGSVAAVQEMRLVQALGYKVTFLPRNLAHLGRYTDDLGRQGIESIYAPFFLSVADYLARHGRDFDAVYVTRYWVARDVLDLLDRHAPQARVLFNNADLHFLREMRAGLAAGDEAQVAQAREVREQELAVMRRADVVLSYTDIEHGIIESHTDGAVRAVRGPWVVDLPERVPGPEGRAGLSFLGSFTHAPNPEAVEWLRRHVLPRLDAGDPAHRLHVYGSAIPAALRAQEGPNLVVEGYVADVADAYDRHRVFVAPLQSGAGIKGKVLGALAHGTPCVLSPIAAEGIGLRHRLDCLIAATPEEWEAALRELGRDDALWRSLSEAGRAYVREAFSFERGLDLMRRAFERADLFPPDR